LSSELIISVSGLRGIVGDTLTQDVAGRYAAAFAEILPSGPVLVTRDGRANGGELMPSVAAGLSQGGFRQVLHAGIAATPTTGVLVREHRCAGGVQISASHNPAEYNGIKLFSAAGRVVPAEVGQRVLERWLLPDAGCRMPVAGFRALGIRHIDDTTSGHLALVEQIVDVERIRARRYRVALDANHGSGSVLGKLLLERLGCEATILGGTPDGLFDHTPEPTAENLAGVLKRVAEGRADIGFCQDPDADRLAIIDAAGRYIGEEYTLAICADHVLRQTPGPVVTNCSTSRMTEDIARKHGVPFYRSAVGEANVVDVMLARGAVLGGEGNGGVIDPRVGLVRDSFVGMALVLDAMAARDLPVAVLADELPRYAICKTKIGLEREKLATAFVALARHFADATPDPDRLDGLRLDWQRADGAGAWLLIRASNTEPIVRIFAEAPTDAEASRLCDEAAALIGVVS
jgi:phosphomannomutase